MYYLTIYLLYSYLKENSKQVGFCGLLSSYKQVDAFCSDNLHFVLTVSINSSAVSAEINMLLIVSDL